MKSIYLPGLLIIVMIVILSFFACAAGPNQLQGSKDEAGSVSGFWQGWWHGFISFFTFIISLFNKNINIYDVHNNGGWYNFGFILGVAMFFGGSGGAGRTACRGNR